MKNNKSISFVCVLFFSLVASARQPQRKNVAQIDHFRIDASKPYAYLEVDSIGPRKPLNADEPSVGIMMHLQNNCRLPIVIVTFTSSNSQNSPYQVMDEVIPNPPLAMGDQVGNAATGFKVGQRDLTDIVLWPNMTEEEIRGVESAFKRSLSNGSKDIGPVRPHGYNDGYLFDRKELTIVPPGGRASFGFPVNHISEAWHIEIPFRLALKREGAIRPPYSYVALFWDDLSEADRSLILKAEKSELTKPENTPAHEAKRSSSSPR